MHSMFTPSHLRRLPAPLAALILSSCASTNPAGDINAAARLATSHTGTQATASWQHDVDVPSSAWNGAAPLTREAAIAVAIANNPKLRMSLAHIAQYRAEVAQATVLPNPTVAFGIGMAIDGMTGAPAMAQGIQALTWLWRRPHHIAQAEAQLQQAVLSTVSDTVQLAASVELAHADVLCIQSLLDYDIQNQSITQETRRLITRRHEVGEAAELDIDRAQVDVDQARLDVIATRKRLTKAKLALLNQLGWPGHDTSWTASGAMTASRPIDSAPEALLEIAARQRLELAVKEAGIRAQVASLDLAETRRLPEINFTLQWQRSFGDRKAILPGGQITIPILDNGDPAIARAAATLHHARMEWLDTANLVVLQVRDAIVGWNLSDQQVALSRNSLVPSASDALARSQAAYAQGVIPLTTLLLAQQQHIAAERTLMTQQLDVVKALIDLRTAVGGTFETLPPPTWATLDEQGDAS